MNGWATIGGALAVLLCMGSGVACSGGGGKNSRGKGPECPEIFAYGFRNPWRMNFDPRVGGDLFVGDVGQSAREEIDIVKSGGNYGWDCREGDVAHTTTADCTGPFQDPEVAHDRSDAQAITGGVVYRGTAIPALFGHYVYGDFITGKFFTFDADVVNAPSEQLTALPGLSVAAFGQARNNDIFAVTFDSPAIRKFVVAPGVGVQGVGFVDAFPGKTFNGAVKLVQHPTIDDRWYVVEQDGFVRVFTGTGATTTAADVRSTVTLGNGGEQGLLGMAFDTDFATTGQIYLTYTNNSAGTVELARWKSSNGGVTFSADTVVLSIPHPEDNHNGGDILFGKDGFLYYSMGDGGGSDDPDNNGQNKETLLGKILRIDVNGTPEAGKKYSVPLSNPFSGNKLCDGTSR